jgi:hypothetical protein
LEASPDGKDVFIRTAQRLVGWDNDTSYDLYDVRVDGGFPDPARADPGCQAEACQGGQSSASVLSTPASLSFAGPGDAQTALPARVQRARVLTRIVHGASFTIAVSVPGTGRIKICAPSIRCATGLAHGAGIYRLRVTLTPKERSLSRRRRLRLLLRMTFAPARGVSGSTVFPLTVRR